MGTVEIDVTIERKSLDLTPYSEFLRRFRDKLQAGLKIGKTHSYLIGVSQFLQAESA
jgi:hypothetical protein